MNDGLTIKLRYTNTGKVSATCTDHSTTESVTRLFIDEITAIHSVASMLMAVSAEMIFEQQFKGGDHGCN